MASRVSSDRKEEFRKRSLICVEELLETDISEHQLIKAAAILSQSQYDDVIDERNIVGVCGYPLCREKLGPVPTQRYRVIVERKQILDITERKKFCSDLCYKCSRYFGSQLSQDPPWARPTQAGERPAIFLLPYSAKGSMDADDDVDTFSRVVESTHTHGRGPGDGSTYCVDVDRTSTNSSESEQSRLSVLSARTAQSQSSFMKISQALSTWLAHSPVSGDSVPMPEVADEGKKVFLPVIHSLTGTQIQWKIFKKQMASSLPKVCGDLKVDLPLAQDRLTELASDFWLDRHCITFKPSEWRVILLLLLIRCELVGESMLDVTECYSVVSGWLSAVKISHAQAQEMLSLLKQGKRLQHW